MSNLESSQPKDIERSPEWSGGNGSSLHLYAGRDYQQDEINQLRAEVRRLQSRLDAAMTGGELAMWDWNLATGEISYNNQWGALLESSVEDMLLRQSLAERLALPGDDEELLRELQLFTEGQVPSFEREFSLRIAPNRMKRVAASARICQRDVSGRALRVIGIWRDVTAKHEGLRAAQEAQRRWERAVAGASDGLFDWDLATGFVWYAPRFRELLEYPDHEFPNTFASFQRALHEQDRVIVMTRLRNHLERRAPLDLNCRLANHKREYRWFRLRAQAERDAAGRPVRLSGGVRDIQEQIDAELALRRNEAFYRTILDALPVAVSYVDREEQVLYANGASAVLFECSIDAARGRHLQQVMRGEVYSQLETSFKDSLNSGGVECRLHAHNGRAEALEMETTFVPHRDADGVMQGSFLLARDIAARLRLEEELRQSHKMEAVGRLTGGVAHDFNNLLSVIVGNVQLLTRSLRDTPRLFKQAEAALRAALRGAELTRRLLSFSRPEPEMLQIASVEGLLGGMMDLFKRTLPADIELKLSVHGVAGSVKVDSSQFENAVLNLVINARDAMPQGGEIRIEASRVTLAKHNRAAAAQSDDALDDLVGDYVLVSVIDDGVGMSAETQQRAFEPFYTTKEFGKGSGLGLAMVYGFATQAGGKIVIDSQPGSGTHIKLYLPCSVERAPTTTTLSDASVALPRGSETILVVDDQRDVRATAVEMLQSLGYRVRAAANGHEALALADQEPNLALVFADVILPGGLSAQGLMQRLRTAHPRVQALFTSGSTESELRDRALLDRPQDVLAKPYQLSELAHRVRALLDQSPWDGQALHQISAESFRANAG